MKVCSFMDIYNRLVISLNVALFNLTVRLCRLFRTVAGGSVVRRAL